MYWLHHINHAPTRALSSTQLNSLSTFLCSLLLQKNMCAVQSSEVEDDNESKRVFEQVKEREWERTRECESSYIHTYIQCNRMVRHKRTDLPHSSRHTILGCNGRIWSYLPTISHSLSLSFSHSLTLTALFKTYSPWLQWYDMTWQTQNDTKMKWIQVNTCMRKSTLTLSLITLSLSLS